MAIDVHNIMSPNEAAEYLSVHPDTIRQLRRHNKLVTVRIDGRTAWVTRDSVMEYQRNRRQRGRPRTVSVPIQRP